MIGGNKIVFTNGCFDILHYGHIKLLEEAKKLGDILIVGVNSDDSVSRLKGKGRPINDLAHRTYMLESLKCVDLVLSFDEDTPLRLIEAIKPHILVKGGDYNAKDVVGANIAENVVIIPLEQGFSTTKIWNTLSAS